MPEKTQRVKKERTPEQVEADRVRMAALRERKKAKKTEEQNNAE